MTIILIAFGILLAVGIGVILSSYFAAKRLIKIALERDAAKDTPENEQKKNDLKGFAEPKAYTKAIAKGTAYLAETATETVTIESYDGTPLTAHYLPAKNPKRVLIAMHGWRSNWKQDFALIAPFLHKEECSVLFCEQRGHGYSGGAYMGFGLLERKDCVKWVEKIHEKEPDLPLYLFGVSMGAATVLMAANAGIDKKVCGIVADCAFTSPHEIWKHVIESNLHISYGLMGRMADRLCRKTIQIGSREFSTVDAMKENNIPTLFIHGTDDHFVPVEMTHENYKACGAKKHLLIVPDADHAMSYYHGKSEYEEALRCFFEGYDKI